MYRKGEQEGDWEGAETRVDEAHPVCKEGNNTMR